jgi:hypothetical protein
MAVLRLNYGPMMPREKSKSSPLKNFPNKFRKGKGWNIMYSWDACSPHLRLIAGLYILASVGNSSEASVDDVHASFVTAFGLLLWLTALSRSGSLEKALVFGKLPLLVKDIETTILKIDYGFARVGAVRTAWRER